LDNIAFGNTADFFSESSPLADHIDHFSVRPGQQKMAAEISATLLNGNNLVCEAGTGIGKTMAYLLPVLLSGKQVIISTGTKHLQDQLFEKDLPVLKKALNKTSKTIVLKGRSNYLCHYRLQSALSEGRFLDANIHLLSAIREWAQSTRTGDLGQFEDMEDNSPLMPWITSTADNCLGQNCDFYDDCFVFKVRRQAQEANLIITNHHLILADMVLREKGFGEVLPMVDTIIFDEAHLLPELATGYFGETLSSRQLVELIEDARVANHKEAGDVKAFLPILDKYEKSIRDLRLCFDKEDRRYQWQQISSSSEFSECINVFKQHQQAVMELLECLRDRGRLLENCRNRCAMHFDFIDTFISTETEDVVQWVDVRGHSFIFNKTPLDIAETFQSRLAQYEANSIFTSATLSVNQNFDHFMHQLGFEDSEQLVIETPFNLREQTLLYIPDDLPEPAQKSFQKAFLQRVVELIEITRGRAFVLFTSHRALKWAAKQIRCKIEYPILVQGEAPRSDLIHQFKTMENAVLLGTSSFWEGVDVKGQALSCVIIEKLPFASPDDPVLQARLAAISRRGGRPFIDYQLPQAMISLKQGVGRLIRDVNDYGVCAICDKRLLSKAYGKQFLNLLSNYPLTHELDDIDHFFHQLDIQQH